MNTRKLKKVLIKILPYVIIGLVLTNLGEAWRLAEGADASKKLLAFFSALGTAFRNPLPSFHPADLLVGVIGGSALWLAVYIRHKNAKHFKHNRNVKRIVDYNQGIDARLINDKNMKKLSGDTIQLSLIHQ